MCNLYANQLDRNEQAIKKHCHNSKKIPVAGATGITVKKSIHEFSNQIFKPPKIMVIFPKGSIT